MIILLYQIGSLIRGVLISTKQVHTYIKNVVVVGMYYLVVAVHDYRHQFCHVSITFLYKKTCVCLCACYYVCIVLQLDQEIKCWAQKKIQGALHHIFTENPQVFLILQLCSHCFMVVLVATGVLVVFVFLLDFQKNLAVCGSHY